MGMISALRLQSGTVLPQDGRQPATGAYRAHIATGRWPGIATCRHFIGALAAVGLMQLVAACSGEPADALAPGQCREHTDCPGLLRCVSSRPGAVRRPGALGQCGCQPTSEDDDAGADAVTQCPGATICDDTGRCVCTADEQCPGRLKCRDSACVCDADADCAAEDGIESACQCLDAVCVDSSNLDDTPSRLCDVPDPVNDCGARARSTPAREDADLRCVSGASLRCDAQGRRACFPDLPQGLPDCGQGAANETGALGPLHVIDFCGRVVCQQDGIDWRLIREGDPCLDDAVAGFWSCVASPVAGEVAAADCVPAEGQNRACRETADDVPVNVECAPLEAQDEGDAFSRDACAPQRDQPCALLLDGAADGRRCAGRLTCTAADTPAGHEGAPGVRCALDAPNACGACGPLLVLSNRLCRNRDPTWSYGLCRQYLAQRGCLITEEGQALPRPVDPFADGARMQPLTPDPMAGEGDTPATLAGCFCQVLDASDDEPWAGFDVCQGGDLSGQNRGQLLEGAPCGPLLADAEADVGAQAAQRMLCTEDRRVIYCAELPTNACDGVGPLEGAPPGTMPDMPCMTDEGAPGHWGCRGAQSMACLADPPTCADDPRVGAACDATAAGQLARTLRTLCQDRRRPDDECRAITEDMFLDQLGDCEFGRWACRPPAPDGATMYCRQAFDCCGGCARPEGMPQCQIGQPICATHQGALAVICLQDQDGDGAVTCADAEQGMAHPCPSTVADCDPGVEWCAQNAQETAACNDAGFATTDRVITEDPDDADAEQPPREPPPEPPPEEPDQGP